MRLSIMALASAQSSPYVAGPTLTERRVSSPVGENHPTLRPGITPWPLFLSAVQQVEMVQHRAGIGTRRDRHARHAAAPGLKFVKIKNWKCPFGKACAARARWPGWGVRGRAAAPEGKSAALSGCERAAKLETPSMAGGPRNLAAMDGLVERPNGDSYGNSGIREKEWRGIRELEWSWNSGGRETGGRRIRMDGNWSGREIGWPRISGRRIRVGVEFGWMEIGACHLEMTRLEK